MVHRLRQHGAEVDLVPDPEVGLQVELAQPAPQVVGLRQAHAHEAAALAGILISSKVATGQPDVGVGLEISAIAAIVIGWILRPQNGALNTVLGAVGLDALQANWLGDPRTAHGEVVEVPVELTHRRTGNNIKGRVHRAMQLRDVSTALLARRFLS